MTKNAYAQSGVDVEAGYEVVARIKKHVARTERAGGYWRSCGLVGDVRPYKNWCERTCFDFRN